MNIYRKFVSNHWFKLILTGSIVLMVIAVFIFFPKNVTRLALFGVFFVCDYYIWRIYRNWFFSQRRLIRRALVSLYWLPSFFLVISMIRVFIIGYDAFINPFVYLLSGVVMLSFIIKFIFALFLLFADFKRYLVWYLRRYPIANKPIKVSKRDRLIVWTGVCSALLFTILFLWGGFVDRTNIKINRVTVESKMLPLSFDEFKIVQLSDIHFISWINQSSFEEVVEVVNDQDPDVVVFTGDLVTFRSSEAIPFIEQMKEIKAKYGVYAILGNHDYGEYLNWKTPEAKEDNMKQMYSLYDEVGWQLMRNSHRYIVNDYNDSIAILGVENWSKNPRFKSKGDIYKALGDVPNSMFKILLTHDPSHWEVLTDRKMEFDLTLSGHTHGMQFAIMTNTVNISPISLIQKYWAGLHQQTINDRDCYLYVNTGLGTVSYPSRYGVPPEVTVLMLRTK